MNRRRRVRVPASSANLGPGYDALAAALSLGLELDVEETGEFSVETGVPGIPTDRTNLCVRAFEALHPADGLSFRIRSEIPPSAGLGSSAAAIVAGLCAADHMYELDAPLFELARELEGHPDNVAAALLRRVRDLRRGRAGAVRPAAGPRGRLAIPPGPVPTAEARAALPERGPDRRRRAQRGARLAAGARPGQGRLLADRARPVRPAAPGPPRAPVSALDGAGAPGARSWARWAPRSPARGRPCCSGATGSRRATCSAALKREASDCDVQRVMFAPGGADVREIE